MRDIARAFSAPVIGRKSKSETFKIYCGGTASVDAPRVGRLWFSGAAIVSGKFCQDVEQFARAYRPNTDILTEIKGNCSFLVASDALAGLYSDPVGATFLYKYSSSEVEAYSSDICHLLYWLDSRCGIVPIKSSFYQSCLLSANDGHFGLSSYEDVVVLPSGTFVTFCGAKRQENNLGVEEYLQAAKSLRYEDLLEEARADILENARALRSAGNAQKIVHLTGGMDSRLMVSALLAVDAMDGFSAFCGGLPGIPDFDTAEKLCGILNMKFGVDSGLYAERMPTSIDEEYDWKAQETLGMFHYPPVHKGYVRRRDPLIVSGGYGECLRGYYLSAAEVETDEMGMQIWGISAEPGRERGISSSAVKEELLELLRRFMYERRSNGWGKFDSLQLLYLMEKNRYFVGQTSQSVLRYTPRIDGLYSLPAFRAAYALDDESRANRKLMFDLMTYFNEDLAHLPFGTTSWPDGLGSSNQRWPDRFPRTRAGEWRAPVSPPSWESKQKKQNNIVELANRIGAPVWQVANFESARKAVVNSMSDGSPIKGVLDKRLVGRLLKVSEPRRQEMRLVYNLLFACRWLG